MAKYALSNSWETPSALTTTYKTQWDITAATGATTLRRAWIYDLTFGTDGTPADNAVTYKVDRQTTTGTRTAAIPAPLDAADAAALTTAGVVTTIEPTVTDNTELLTIAMNQRATYRWVAAPGSELVMPATNVAGIGGRAKSPAYTGTCVATMMFME